MKLKKQIYLSIFAMLSLLSVVLYSCLDDSILDLQEVMDPAELARLQEISDARTFFENYVSTLPMDMTPQGIHPGNFAVDWKHAAYIENTTDSIISLNACIIPEYHYVGAFAKDYTQVPETEDDWYTTVVSQKIVSLKDMRTDARACYIITIIPDASCASQSRGEIDKLFNNGDDEGNLNFSGLTIFSTLGDNSTVVIDRYYQGQRFARASVFDDNDYSSLIGAAEIKQFKPLRTKNNNEILDWGAGWDEFTIIVDKNIGTQTIFYREPIGGQTIPPSISITGGGGGGSSLGGLWGGANASKGARLFNTGPLSNAALDKINKMLDEIVRDCMGLELFERVEIRLLNSGQKINLQWGASSNGSTVTDHRWDGTRTFNMRLTSNAEVDTYFHELFHIYQYFTEGTAVDADKSAANLEIETRYATYVYQKNRSDYKERWEDEYQDGYFNQSIAQIENYLNDKGYLLPGRSEDFLELHLRHQPRGILEGNIHYGGYQYNYDKYGRDNFRNLRVLSTYC